jgi:DNA-nicking Smr family endonuclease
MAFPAPTTLMNNNSYSHTTTSQWANTSFASQATTTTVADEAAVDAYAMKVLEDASPPDVAVDAEYLGSYITGVLRAEEVSASHLEELPDYDNVLELLQEHCSMTRTDAVATLHKIAQAVDTGIIPRSQVGTSPPLGPFESHRTSSNATGLTALQLLESVNVEKAVEESHNNSNAELSLLRHQLIDTAEQTSSDPNIPSSTASSIISPVQPDNLIPFDLLGAMDDEEDSPSSLLSMAPSTSPLLEDEFPSLAVAATSKISKKASRSSRSRQGSIDESSSLLSSSEQSSRKVSPNLRPACLPAAAPQQPFYYTLDDADADATDLHQDDPATMLQMACDYLQQTNPDMGADAIFHAATMAESNVGIAQYLMDCAMTAPPVCRHLLNSGCYRRDCQFSHDLDSHTCVFWVRGRCTKGTSCPFLHGYNEKWFVQLEEAQQQQQQQEAELEQRACQLQQEQDYPYYHDGWDHGSQQQQNATDTTGSFANIASQGYNDQTAFQQPVRSLDDNNQYIEESKFAIGSIPTMQIPQNVWNPHERRDASAFHIVDPMERYREVSRLHLESSASGRTSSSYNRTDVIDLHFQSTKTYAVVLEQVLPEKLTSESQGVWIVTGTGHHVGSKTHQKGGGVLESAVMSWLAEHGYDFWKGKDRNGHGGALFVKYSSSTSQEQ